MMDTPGDTKGETADQQLEARRNTSDDVTAKTKNPNGWNGTFIQAQDTYALMRDCNASTR